MLDPKTLSAPEIYKINKNAQRSFIAISAFEYFASLLVSGVFLASLLTKIGVPDSVAGIVASLTSFGSLAQIAALFFADRVQSAKRLVATTHILSQLMLVTLYLVPFVEVPQAAKTALFVILYLVATFAKMIINPVRTTFNMSYVNAQTRGSYTATNEIVSLIGGMAFTWIMSALIDYYDMIGQSHTGFILSGITLFGLSLLILLCYLPVKEVKSPEKSKTKSSLKQALRGTLGDKRFRKIIYLNMIWSVANGLSVPFYGTYINNELGISLVAVSIISSVACGARAIFSRPMGRFADRTSRSKVLVICLGAGALSFLATTFAMPANGMVMYCLYIFFNAIYASGISNGITNIVFDYIKPDMIVNAFSIQGALGGTVSLIATLIGARVVSSMQAGGNMLFGITVYPQQVLSLVSCLIFVGLIVYVKTVIQKLKRIEE